MAGDTKIEVEIAEILLSLTERPTMWARTPYEAEARFDSLLPVLVALKLGCSLSAALDMVRECRESVLANIEAGTTQYVFICEEACFPERVASFHQFSNKAGELVQCLERNYQVGFP